ncbi:PAS domain-containing protein [Psidium guajava]|nr:PAS domain-containing protein [Psidium guajava]
MTIFLILLALFTLAHHVFRGPLHRHQNLRGGGLWMRTKQGTSTESHVLLILESFFKYWAFWLGDLSRGDVHLNLISALHGGCCTKDQRGPYRLII